MIIFSSGPSSYSILGFNLSFFSSFIQTYGATNIDVKVPTISPTNIAMLNSLISLAPKISNTTTEVSVVIVVKILLVIALDKQSFTIISSEFFSLFFFFSLIKSNITIVSFIE